MTAFLHLRLLQFTFQITLPHYMFPQIHPCQPRSLPFNEVSILTSFRMLFHFAGSLIYSPRYSQSPNSRIALSDPIPALIGVRRCFADASNIFCPNAIALLDTHWRCEALKQRFYSVEFDPSVVLLAHQWLAGRTRTRTPPITRKSR